jgi:aminoglycoside phosphotransferase (APT) family kinase protein
MERVEGPTMVEAFSKAPWRLSSLARELARLHNELHQLSAPDFLSPAPVGRGHAVVHLDLHPLNVLVGPRGPVVIDWTMAALGDPDADVALAWLLMASGEVPGARAKRAALNLARGAVLRAFLGGVDRDRAARQMLEVCEWKATDANMSEREVASMREVARRAASSAG